MAYRHGYRVSMHAENFGERLDAEPEINQPLLCVRVKIGLFNSGHGFSELEC